MHNIHLVSHTHWDREWYLPFQVFRIKLVRLMDNLLDLLQSDPDYKHFTLDGQTIILEDYLRIRPEREGELRAHIENGRLLIGPWHILPDEFLVSPEALVRNLLVGDQVARRFGAKMEVGYIPDPFGHIGQMPQVLRGFGISTVCLQRGLSDEPVEFWWEAPDGSQVLMSYLRDGYGNASGLPTTLPERFAEEVFRLRDSLLAASAFAEGGPVLLMQGTDHLEPQPETPVSIGYANKASEDSRILHSSLPAYFAEVQQALNLRNILLPVVRGELRDSRRYHLLPGVLSARMWIKQRNHACQTILEKWAEPFSTWAGLVAAPQKAQTIDLNRAGAASLWLSHPEGALHEAWKLLLECHPHDSICGCSVDQVHEEMRPRFDQVEQIGEEVTRQSLEILAETVDTTPPRGLSSDMQQPFQAVVAFNPLSTPQTGLVRFSIEQVNGGDNYEVVDETGAVLPHQSTGLDTRELVNWVIDRAGFKTAIGMTGAGQVAGMVVLDINFQQTGKQVQVEVLVAETGQVDLDAWDQGVQELLRLAEDPDIETFHVQVRMAPTREVFFIAQEVPGPGLRTFWVRPRPESSSQPEQEPIPAAGIQNQFFRVEASPDDGTLTLVDLRSRAVYGGLNRFEDIGDRGDEYNFCPLGNDPPPTPQSVEIRMERGLVQQTLEVHLELVVPARLAPDRQSRSTDQQVITVVTRASLYLGVPRLDIETTVDNQAEDHRLRVYFPAPFDTHEAWYDGHYEVIHRPIETPPYLEKSAEQPRPERPQRSFTAVSGSQTGLMVANRGLPEVEVLRTEAGHAEIALTLLRCVGWLSRDDFPCRQGQAGPQLATPGAQEPGPHRFHYAVIPFICPGESVSSPEQLPFEQAYAFSAALTRQMMRAASTGIHTGELPPQSSIVSISPRTFVLSAIKRAEDRSGWVVRGYNISSETIPVSVIPFRPSQPIQRVNLAEKGQSAIEARPSDKQKMEARGHEVMSLLFSDIK